MTRGHVARDALAGALCLVMPWLRILGFEISIGKCQFAVFTRSRSNLSVLVLSVEGHDLRCLAGIKYLGGDFGSTAYMGSSYPDAI